MNLTINGCRLNVEDLGPRDAPVIIAHHGGGGIGSLQEPKDTFGPLTFVAALWRKDADAIAHYGQIHGIEAGDTASLAELVRERTRPVGVEERTGIMAQADALMGKVMAMALPKAFRV